jgi:hypothetical protein
VNLELVKYKNKDHRQSFSVVGVGDLTIILKKAWILDQVEDDKQIRKTPLITEWCFSF